MSRPRSDALSTGTGPRPGLPSTPSLRMNWPREVLTPNQMPSGLLFGHLAKHEGEYVFGNPEQQEGGHILGDSIKTEEQKASVKTEIKEEIKEENEPSSAFVLAGEIRNKIKKERLKFEIKEEITPAVKIETDVETGEPSIMNHPVYGEAITEEVEEAQAQVIPEEPRIIAVTKPPSASFFGQTIPEGLVDFTATGKGRIDQDQDNNVGILIYNAVNENIVIKPQCCKLLNTGLSIAKWHAKNYYLQLLTRPCFAKKNIAVLGGIIDPGYTGEIMVVLSNLNDKTVLINRNIAIAQMVFSSFQPAKVVCDSALKGFVPNGGITIIDDVELCLKRLTIKAGKENRPPKAPLTDNDDSVLLGRALS